MNVKIIIFCRGTKDSDSVVMDYVMSLVSRSLLLLFALVCFVSDSIIVVVDSCFFSTVGLLLLKVFSICSFKVYDILYEVVPFFLLERFGCQKD